MSKATQTYRKQDALCAKKKKLKTNRTETQDETTLACEESRGILVPLCLTRKELFFLLWRKPTFETLLNGVRILLGYFNFYFLPFVGLLPRRPTPNIFHWLFPCTQRHFFFFLHIGGLCTPPPLRSTSLENVSSPSLRRLYSSGEPGPPRGLRASSGVRQRHVPMITAVIALWLPKKKKKVMCLHSAFLPCLRIPDEEQRRLTNENNRMRRVLSWHLEELFFYSLALEGGLRLSSQSLCSVGQPQNKTSQPFSHIVVDVTWDRELSFLVIYQFITN